MKNLENTATETKLVVLSRNTS